MDKEKVYELREKHNQETMQKHFNNENVVSLIKEIQNIIINGGGVEHPTRSCIIINLERKLNDYIPDTEETNAIFQITGINITGYRRHLVNCSCTALGCIPYGKVVGFLLRNFVFHDYTGCGYVLHVEYDQRKQ